jgi:toxin ParE1/3/4
MKTYTVTYSAGADQDLTHLAAVIMEQASEERAIRYIGKIINECRSLSLAPYRGTKRRNLRPNMRVIGFKREVSILFRIEEETRLVVILGFAYGGRTLTEVLRRNE